MRVRARACWSGDMVECIGLTEECVFREDNCMK